MTKYTDIIERLQKATGPNYALEVDVFKLVNPEYADYSQGRGGLIHPQDGEDVRVQSNVRAPNYTASIDAAIALVEKILPQANCYGFDKDPHGVTAYVSRNNVSSGHWLKEADAPTAPLALLLALFRALDAQEAAQ